MFKITLLFMVGLLSVHANAIQNISSGSPVVVTPILVAPITDPLAPVTSTTTTQNQSTATATVLSGTSSTVTSAACVEGDSCSNASGSGVWTSGCCTGGPKGAQTCLAPPITCSSKGVSSTTSSVATALPACADGTQCTNQAGLTGTWNKGCCVGGKGSTQVCLAPPISSCDVGTTPVASTTCNVGDACMGSQGQIGTMTQSQGCCTSGPFGSCLTAPYTCPPQYIGTTSSTTSGGGTVVSVVSGSGTTVTVVDPFQISAGVCLKGFNMGAGMCTIDQTLHTCASGGTVSSVASGEVFDDFVNQKLKCCMHGIGPSDAFAKYDCIENASQKFANFNELWASSDDLVNGGKMNAILLTGPSGSKQALTGFYTTEGKYCSEFSEFVAPADGIQPYKIDGATKTPIGQAYPLPDSIDTIRAKLLGKRRYPTTIEEMKRCPVLLRAALLVKCGVNTPIAGAQPKTYTDLTQAKDKARCTTASSVQVHLRLEQIYQIAGQANLKTIDTITDHNQTSSISVDAILKSQN